MSTQKPKKSKIQKAPLEKDPQSLIKLLQQQTLFKGLTLDELRTIDKQVVVRPVPADTHLLTTTEQGTEVYYLLTGRVKIYTQEQHGYCVTLGFREKGELLGEISTIDGLLPSANVITTEPSSVLVFKKRHFLRYLKTMPSLAFHV